MIIGIISGITSGLFAAYVFDAPDLIVFLIAAVVTFVVSTFVEGY